MGFRIKSFTHQSTTHPKMKAFVAISTLLAAATANQTSHQVIKHGSTVAVHSPVYHAPIVHRPAPYHPAPVVHRPTNVYQPAPVVHRPAPYHPTPAYKEPSYDEPAVYHYGYAVADDYSGANFAQNENRDGYATTGEYRVALPDGRTQIVTYNVADGYSGYVADVKYEGVAQYPEYKPAPHPRPAYHA